MPSDLSLDGKCLACTYRAKFVEVSVGINHNVDELLAGTLTQIRLKKEHCELQVITATLNSNFPLETRESQRRDRGVKSFSGQPTMREANSFSDEFLFFLSLLQGPKESSHSWYKNRNVVRASMKARQMITWIFGKEDSKFKNCENLQVL